MSLRIHREQAVFRLLLSDPKVLDRADLEARHFLDPHARRLWEAGRQLRAAGRDVTGYTLALVGGKTDTERENLRAYLRECRSSLAQGDDLPALVTEIRAEADLDALADVLAVASKHVEHRDASAEEIVSDAVAKLQGAVRRSRRRAVPISELVRDATAGIFEACKAVERGEAPVARIPTGLVSLDLRIGGGYARGSWTVVGARPGGSKTAYLMQTARRAPVPALVLAYEEVRDLAYREIASETGISAADIAGHRFNSGQLSRVLAAVHTMRNDVYLVDARGMDAHALAREIRAQVEEHGVGLVVVDYLNRIRHPKADRYDLSIRRTMEILDDVVGELDVAGVMGAQLSRSFVKEQRLPRVEDFRDGGAIEEICKLGMMLHRPYASGKDDKGNPHDDDEIWLIVDKQNLGRHRALVPCDWDGPSLTIEDRAPRAEPHYQEAMDA